MKRLPGLLRSIVSALLFIPLVAAAAPLEMHEVADGIYVHQGVHEDFDENYHGDIANIGFIVGDEAVAVVDTGGSYLVGRALHEAIRAVTQLPIKYVINTHAHPDHIFGNAAFADDKPAFVGNAKLAAQLYASQDTYLRNLKQELGEKAKGSEIVLPTLKVEGEKTLDLGNRILKLNTWPTAHTNTDLTGYDEKTKTLWTGDLLFSERTPSLDGDIKGWLAAIPKLEAIPATTVIPGHGPVSHQPGQAWSKEKTYLETLLTDVRGDIKAGNDLNYSMDHAGQSEKDKWVLFGIVNRRNVNILYPKLEWED
ncbi:MAG TPA: quinoprotein relay system zinc metallohydrolase 2 [Methylophilaceae bacterium]|nr:quinoprotein relay system zinc metallohydrolase 2 [Methylophilaceae bacterium]